MRLFFTFYLLFLTPVFIYTQYSELDGAWIKKENDKNNLLLIKDGYMTLTIFTDSNFIGTAGGVITHNEDEIKITGEFNTAGNKLKTERYPYKLKDEVIQIGEDYFKRLDDGDAPLAGVWRITQRMKDEKLQTVHQTGTRKTLKLLTGTRFQWFAFDPDGNKFFGTGGGTYTFQNGEYTEYIDFFSRDNSRVGNTLSFEGKVEYGKKWIHTGLSSKGEPIHEVWERE